MYLSDTIAAVSTPVGEGGIAVIRISGPDSLCIIRSLFKRKNDGGFLSHRFYYGDIVSPDSGVIVDEAMCVFMQAPRSFTCEDVVEIQCHSGTLIIQQILALVLASGARLAEPGEFTRRAFLNGRIDLLQAEAVIDLIRGKTEASLKIARQQSDGVLSVALIEIRDLIRNALALAEAYIDFPDEDMGETDIYQFRSQLFTALSQIDALVASYEEGRLFLDGVSVLIAGKPNVGKSSLLNTLLKEKRAIVTSVPGTTRDLIEEVVNINGLPVKLLDTAGIRNPEDPVEREGVSRALQRIPTADLILHLLDSSRSFDSEDRLVADSLAGFNTLIVCNKADLPVNLTLPADLQNRPAVSISTVSGEGIEDLKRLITESFLHGKAIDSREPTLLSKVRHRDVLQSVAGMLRALIDDPEKLVHGELVAIDLREALHRLGQITGETATDDILDLIFSQFCIGK
jgi:tRNA modification GTPase